jgi:hypothetical protein
LHDFYYQRESNEKLKALMSLQCPDLHQLNSGKRFPKIFSWDGVIRLRISMSAKNYCGGQR